MRISKIYLYDEPAVPELKMLELAKFIEETFSIKTEVRNNIFKNASKKLAEQICSCRIFNTACQFKKHTPSSDEVSFEFATFSDSSLAENILLYDGFEFNKALQSLIPENESTIDKFHIVFTNKLTCTFDNSDNRYHGRAIICSNPTIISTTGIIEAPAKSREYYFEILSKMPKGLNLDSIKKKYSGTYLEYHDQLLSEIAKGYLMQGIFYYLTGEPFCNSLECRLYNPHWQKDLLYSQITIGKLCKKHQKILEKLCTI